VGFDAKDLAAWSSFGQDVLGLEIGDRRDDGTLVFRLDEYAYRLSISPGTSDDVAFLGWEVSGAAELAAVADRVRTSGVLVTEELPQAAADRCVAKLISFVDPDGLRSEVFYGPLLLADAPFNSPRGIGQFVTGEQGHGHVVLFPNDIDANVRFYCEVLGFRISDYIDAQTPRGPLNLTFLRCSPRHHSLAFGTRLASCPRRAVQTVPAAGTSKCTGPSVVGWSKWLARPMPLPSGRER